MADFSLTSRQAQANQLLASPATHVMLEGGSRSGKTFLECRAIAVRAIKAPGSRHAILRFRFNAVKASIVLDTWPKMMQLCFPGVPWSVSRTDWYATVGDGSEVWFGGLDEKERTEKILGQEYATIAFNECSQIPYASRNMALTRLAQRVMVRVEGVAPYPLPLKAYYDQNPPAKTHWTYRLFHQHVDPDSRALLANREDYACMQMNPDDNRANLPVEYFKVLDSLPARVRRRFRDGQYADTNPNALFREEHLDRWREEFGQLPDMQRIVIAVDPSGSGDDDDNSDTDAIGIVVAGLGTDGVGYCLEDLTIKAGPATWGRVVTSAYERHAADRIVAEVNFGGAMVRQVIRTAAKRDLPYRELRASRGKVVRAEPIAALVEQGKVRMAGRYNELEEELSGFTTNGFIGPRSPNRADAFVWAMTELFPGIASERKAPTPAGAYRPTIAIGL